MIVGASGGEEGRMRQSVGRRVNKASAHAHMDTHTPMKLRQGCCLNAWNAVGLIKVKNKRGKRGGWKV